MAMVGEFQPGLLMAKMVEQGISWIQAEASFRHVKLSTDPYPFSGHCTFASC